MARARELNLFLWAGYLLAVGILVWIRPIHQDDGWYASFAFEFLNGLGAERFATWDYTDVFHGDSGKSGFVFTLVQSAFIALFGYRVLYTKVLAFLAAMAALVCAAGFVSTFNRRWAAWLPLLLLLWPRFPYHFYNRPEMLATALAFAGLWLIARPSPGKGAVALAYVIPFLCFDTHPISVFLMFGWYVAFFATASGLRRYALLGACAGLSFYLLGNYLVNGSLGLFSPLIGVKVTRGDHYIPLLESTLANIVDIAVQRYKYLGAVCLASLLWLPPLLRRREIGPESWLRYRPLIAVTCSFLILSTAFTEAVGNGFALYSSMLVFIWLFVALRFAATRVTGAWRAAFLAPIVLVLALANYRQLPTYLSWARYAASFEQRYYALGERIPKGSRVLARPTFAFTFAKNSGTFEYTYGLLYYMKVNRRDFAQAIRAKGYDYIAFDPEDERDMFLEERREVWGGFNPYYESLKKVGLHRAEFEGLVRRGILVPVFTYDEISHGFTTFYRVDQGRLAGYLGRA